MRLRVFISLGLVGAVMLSALLLAGGGREPVSVMFDGYRDWRKFDTNWSGGVQALFIVTNNTGRGDLYTTDDKARVQVKTPTGWIDYKGPNDLFRGDRHHLFSDGCNWFSLDFPKEPVTWRFHLSYTVPPPRWSGLKILGPVRSLFKLEAKQLEAWSQEITNAPTR